jgi:Amt family ammonium transporter
MTEIQYILNTFLLLYAGAMVFFIASGFAMLESGLVRTKNTTAMYTFDDYKQLSSEGVR